jgi:transcriptional regulator GlxA family with amidase domain
LDAIAPSLAEGGFGDARNCFRRCLRRVARRHGAVGATARPATVRRIGLTDPRFSPIAEAVQWIRQHYRESFRVEELAERTGMSPSAFHRNFQAVTATTPIQFQKEIRLQEARLLLAANPGDVAGIGYLVGYDSPSQFSREYCRLFGTPPSQGAIRFTARADDEPE